MSELSRRLQGARAKRQPELAPADPSREWVRRKEAQGEAWAVVRSQREGEGVGAARGP